MAARRFLAVLAVLAVLAIGALLALRPTAAAQAGRELHVPAVYASIEAAIAASTAGDVIVLAAGTYDGDVTVPEDKGGITIRGVDRNTVVFDGANIRHDAIEVEADGVTLENLSAHDFIDNGFYWDGVAGFAGRYLTVWNVGLYGIYAIQSRNGTIEQSFVSGAADAAFYIGECYPCDTLVRKVTARLSAVGYSGTNAGGGLVLEDSTFEANSVGILPNSYDVGLAKPPQREATFRRNVVRDSGTVPTPRQTPLGGFHGIGIGVVGGVGNVVEGNEVTGSARYGLVVVPAIDREGPWVPANNRITGNHVSRSGIADIAMSAGSGAGNCFAGNTAAVLDPPDLGASCPAEGAGSQQAAATLALPPPQLDRDLPPAPPYRTMPVPGEQASMPADVRAESAADLAWLVIPAALLVVGLAALGLLFRQHRGGPVSPSRG